MKFTFCCCKIVYIDIVVSFCFLRTEELFFDSSLVLWCEHYISPLRNRNRFGLLLLVAYLISLPRHGNALPSRRAMRLTAAWRWPCRPEEQVADRADRCSGKKGAEGLCICEWGDAAPSAVCPTADVISWLFKMIFVVLVPKFDKKVKTMCAPFKLNC